MSTKPADIGLVGLAVMGQNLALNIADHGYNIAVYNRNPEKTREFIAQNQANEPSHERVVGFEDLAHSYSASNARAKLYYWLKQVAQPMSPSMLYCPSSNKATSSSTVVIPCGQIRFVVKKNSAPKGLILSALACLAVKLARASAHHSCRAAPAKRGLH